MIYTVTFNPSLDYAVAVNDFQKGTINRTTRENIFPGGKGLNVSRVLKHLEKDSVALGFIAGFTGEAIRQQMEAEGCNCCFIPVANGMSRINVKLHSDEETEINGQGPEIGEAEVREFYEILDELKKGDYLVLAGSIPDTLSNNIYREIMEYGQGKGIRYVVDATGDLLVNVLPYRPFLIKPNNHEISEIFHKEISSAEDLIFYGKKLQEMGAQNVLISRAGDGAILLTAKGEVLESPAPEGKVVNSVGAGDSMVAGFLAGYADTRDYREAFYQGISAGSATAFHADLATKEEILEVRKQFAK